jgi:hypothetical protein
MDLYDAWCHVASLLKPQAQGDCGLYSFWYATVLLNHLDNTKPIIYPRKMEDPMGVQSMRKEAKTLVKSGQGEILTSNEMAKIISHFGYGSRRMRGTDSAWRKRFITGSLGQNAPVLFPYTKGMSGPVDAATATGRPGQEYGSHWSLIIKEERDQYIYLDPHYPNTPQRKTKDDVLKSNMNVDNQVYERMWVKLLPATKKRGTIGPESSNMAHTGKRYDIGQPGRDAQQLSGVLVAVY